MKLKLTTGKTIKDLKQQFSGYFPNLKLEFFADEHRQGQSSSLGLRLDDNVKLSEITSIHGEQYFEFEPSTTVAAFEQGLQNDFDLSVQVFRKSGSIWLETIQTDNLTLEKQERMSAESSRPRQFNIYTLFL